MGRDGASSCLRAQATSLNALGLPKRNPLRTFGIDGGYVKAADAVARPGWFEIVVGKSLPHR